MKKPIKVKPKRVIRPLPTLDLPTLPRKDKPTVRRMIAYYRVSSKGQADNTSLEDQRRRITTYCEYNNIKLIAEFEEVGSAKDKNGALVREKFIAALNAMEESKADGLIVWDIDRFYRDLEGGLRVFRENFQDTDKALISVQMGSAIDTSTNTGWYCFAQMLLTAEYAWRMTTQRTKRGTEIARAKGQVVGTVPYGWRREADKMLRPDDHEQRIIKKIKKYSQDGMSYQRIANHFNYVLCIYTRKGTEWQPTQIERILKSARNEHLTQLHGGEVLKLSKIEKEYS